jgi:pilus assembly protein CpaC
MTIMTLTHKNSPLVPGTGLASPTRIRAKVGKVVAWILIVAVLDSAVLAQVVAVPATSASATSAAPVAPAAGVDTEASAVRLVTGRSTVLDVGTPITRVSLTSADIADALVTSSSQLLIHGKAPGTISLFVWERSGAVRRYEVIVARDVAKLADELKRLFPNEGIDVSSNGRDVVLAGTVSKKEIADQVINLSAGFVDKKEDVVSLLRVQNATNQVLLRVRFAEVSRSAMTELGASFFTSPLGRDGWVGRTTTQQFAAPEFDNDKLTFSDFLNLFIFNTEENLGTVIRALQKRGLFQSLAEPNLVAESGKEASFLAGGEFPIPVVQPGAGSNAITVQFKEFGVRLNFTPVVQGDRIRLKVRPEVSSLDFANGVSLSGFRIPALVSRRTETELELRDGQTFAIAGLLNNTVASTMQKIPGIGDIPIIGYLFRSKAATKDRTELVVMITPQILPEGSFGVTRDLPRLGEPVLETLPNNRSQVPPPAAFPQPGRPAGNASVAPDALAPATESVAPAAAAVMSAPAAPAPSRSETLNLDAGTAPPPAPTMTAAERKAAERAAAQERKDLERAEKAKAEEERRLQRIEAEAAKAAAERQKKAAAEQAKRDAEAARVKAAEDRRAAEEAKRREAEEAKKKAAVEEAAAKVRAAEAAYQAEVARSSRQ